jgi:serine/threonine protein kinase
MEGGLTSDKLVIMFLVAKAVAYLKHKNVVHRDLKPANIIVNWDESLELG